MLKASACWQNTPFCLSAAGTLKRGQELWCRWLEGSWAFSWVWQKVWSRCHAAETGVVPLQDAAGWFGLHSHLWVGCGEGKTPGDTNRYLRALNITYPLTLRCALAKGQHWGCGAELCLWLCWSCAGAPRGRERSVWQGDTDGFLQYW